MENWLKSKKVYKKIGQGGREGIERQARNGGKARRPDNEIVGNAGYETTTGTTTECPAWTEDPEKRLQGQRGQTGGARRGGRMKKEGLSSQTGPPDNHRMN